MIHEKTEDQKGQVIFQSYMAVLNKASAKRKEEKKEGGREGVGGVKRERERRQKERKREKRKSILSIVYVCSGWYNKAWPKTSLAIIPVWSFNINNNDYLFIIYFVIYSPLSHTLSLRVLCGNLPRIIIVGFLLLRTEKRENRTNKFVEFVY